MSSSTRWSLTLEYHGADFVGWQIQPNGRSVQAVVQAALRGLLGHPVRVTVSGRTDSGVHAWGQVVSFVTDAERTPRAMRDGLNACLPEDVACLEASQVVDDFDPRRWTRSKLYRYTWLDRRARSPLLRDRVWHVPRGLDEQLMAEAAQVLVGRHDFSSFRAAGCASVHPIREIEALQVRRSAHLIEMDVTGNGFLRHMVRIVAGTLAEVGGGKRPVSWLQEVLEARDRSAAGRTAPANGLALISVRYGDDRPPWHEGSRPE